MQEDKYLFIEYANNSLKDSPYNFNKIIGAMEDEFGPVYSVTDLPSLVPGDMHDWWQITPASHLYSILSRAILHYGQDLNGAIIKRGRIRTPPGIMINVEGRGHEEDYFHMCGDGGITSDKLATLNSRDLNIDAEMEIGFEAAYGFLDKQCHYTDEDGWGYSPCLSFNPWVENVDFAIRLRAPHIKCYQCHQKAFIEILNKTISGQSYVKIIGFEHLLHLGFSNYRQAVSLSGPHQIDVIMGWRSLFDHQGHLLHGPDTEYPFKYVFNHLLMGIVAHSLGKFLATNGNRRNLHKCAVCEDFFVGHASRKVCPKPKDCERLRNNLKAAEGMAKIRKNRDVQRKEKWKMESEQRAEILRKELFKPKC